jgi:multidrug efflux pump subunit AcrA (membrane-fusion protein)
MMPTSNRTASGSRTSAFLIAIGAAALGASSCRKPTAAAPPIPEVLVAKVTQRDAPIYSESVGTTEGFVNAQVRPRVEGDLLRQTYADGAAVKAGDLLFEIDDRTYRAALDEARANLARQQAALKKYELDVARYTPLEAEKAVSREELDNAIQASRGAKAQVGAAAAALETARLNLVLGADEPEIEMILVDGKPYPHPGRFQVVNRQVEVGTGTILIQALFPNPTEFCGPASTPSSGRRPS